VKSEYAKNRLEQIILGAANTSRHVQRFSYTCEFCGYTGACARPSKRFCDIDCRDKARRKARSPLPSYITLSAPVTCETDITRIQRGQREMLKRRQLQTEIDGIEFNAGGMTDDERRSYRLELKGRIGNVRI